ncbi:MAG: alanine racemase [Anaerolineae bacterium]|nr:alanine racemase [Anaerolineae bacterium]
MRPTFAEVNLAQLTANYRAIQARVAPAQVMPVIKANAYGHGLVPVARHLESLGVPYLGVALVEEGVQLRENGITTPILVLGGSMREQVPLFLEHELTIAAASLEKLAHIEEGARRLGKRARIHLKIDTGMGRLGVQYYSAAGFLEAALRSEHCRVEGIFSHFANADAADLSSAREQLARFTEVLRFYEERGIAPPLRHMANSAAILQLPESHFDMVRAGIMLYGVYPSPEVPRTVSVGPVLSWKSHAVYVKTLRPGQPVSYGSTWQADHPVRIITVPAGYGDGYLRALSNRSEVIIHGRRYPVAGRVCMDQIMVNVEQDTVYPGDEVILLGESRGARISAEELAAWAGTIGYEILTNINGRVPRVYV